MRIVFMGTPDFAVPALQALIDSQHDVAAVYTQPPRPAGRGMKLTPSPVQQLAEKYGIPVEYPEKLTVEATEKLKTYSPEMLVVAAYGLLLPQRVLDIAPSLNIHPSRLPRWRGAAPLQHTVMAGDTETDLCIMHMVKALDAGDVYLRLPYILKANETAGSLHDTMATMGAEGLLEVINDWKNYRTQAVPQQGDVVYAHKIDNTTRALNFSRPAKALQSHVRGLSPWPGATASLNGETYKINAVQVVTGHGKAGEILQADDKNGLVVACGEGALRLTQLQRPGKAMMDDTAMLRGYSLPVGAVFDAAL